jgi:endonuclease/exonuclease/phosphatase family metal-dependent hydrolase
MKKIYEALIISIFALVLMGISGCDTAGPEPKIQAQSRQTVITVMTWNVQALFDGVESGNEYDEYRNSTGWSAEKYSGRLNAIARAMDSIEGGAPDIFALEEIESSGVMEDLAGALSKFHYISSYFAGNPGYSLGVGVLSRFPFVSAKSHSVTINGETAPRPILELRLMVNDAPLALFVCHWKSKLGGDDATEAMRRSSARIILRRLREIREEDPGIPAVIMGDLNENYDEFYRRNAETLCALLPDDPRSAALAGFTEAAGETPADFIILSKTKPPAARYFPQEAVSLYDPWAQELENGSYYYQSKWETIDHFLLSAPLFDKAEWDFDSAQVIRDPPFTNAKGNPAAYNPRTGSGLSDHLPLLLTLKMVNR